MSSRSEVTTCTSFNFSTYVVSVCNTVAGNTRLRVVPRRVHLSFVKLRHCFRRGNVARSFVAARIKERFTLRVSYGDLECLSMKKRGLIPYRPPGSCGFVGTCKPARTAVFAAMFRISGCCPGIPVKGTLSGIGLCVASGLKRVLPPNTYKRLVVAN